MATFERMWGLNMDELMVFMNVLMDFRSIMMRIVMMNFGIGMKD